MAEKNKASKKATKKKKNVFSRCKKISWPTWQHTTRNFGIVLVVIILCGLVIFGVDRGLYALLDLVMETANT